jgi:hypothetical protein
MLLAPELQAGMKVDRARATHSWENGWWSSWRPAARQPNIVARPVGEPTVTSNIAREKSNAVARPAKPPETAKADPSPKKPRQAAKRSSRSKSARREPPPKPASENPEAQWWEKDGNPAVFAFSECVASYAAQAVKAGSQASHPEFVTEAMAGPCKAPFDEMAGLLLKHHGEKGFAKVSRELIDTTFIPAVRKAVDGVAVELTAEETRRAELAKELQQAKDTMFECFVRETDRLAASPTEADAAGEAVISMCSGDADRFFGKLEELYPDTSAGARANKQTALSESYLPAILTRITAIRAARLNQQ